MHRRQREIARNARSRDDLADASDTEWNLLLEAVDDEQD